LNDAQELLQSSLMGGVVWFEQILHSVDVDQTALVDTPWLRIVAFKYVLECEESLGVLWVLLSEAFERELISAIDTLLTRPKALFLGAC
jgi:hypothetical protein